MVTILRNQEFKVFTFVYLIFGIIFIGIGFLMDVTVGLVIGGGTSLGYGLFYTFTRRRYDGIANMSYEIDKVLHDEDYIYIGDSSEGELSILQSEIIKMTLRIRDQNRSLAREKDNLGNSLADIAHQLKTPLTSANLILSLLRDGSGTQRELLGDLNSLLDHMDWLITVLLKVSKLEAGIVEFKEEDVDIKDLVGQVVGPFLLLMDLHHIQLEVDISKDMVVRGDFNWLVEALQNILKNCMEKVKGGGRLKISANRTPLYLELRIEDDGPGFNEEDLAHIFDRFYKGQALKNTKGFGIGLNLAKMIINGLGGTISGKNNPDGGALFLIRFPPR